MGFGQIVDQNSDEKKVGAGRIVEQNSDKKRWVYSIDYVEQQIRIVMLMKKK